MEYTYKTQTSVTAATMDYASYSSGFAYKCTTRIQVSGNTFNVELSDVEFTEYVGSGLSSTNWPYQNQNWESVRVPNMKFAVKHDSSGVFSEVVVPSGADIWQRNLIRGWAGRLQINAAKIKAGEKGFKSREAQLQGNCQMTYSVTPTAIVKTTSHTTDCENRVYRLVDDFRGYRCDSQSMNSGMNYPSSQGTDVYVLEKKGSTYQVNAMVSTSAFMAQYFEEEGSAQSIFTNSTSILTGAKSSPGDISVSGNSITDLSYEFSDSEYAWDKTRDLKAREAFFSSGMYFKEDLNTVKNAIKKGIAFQKTILDTLDKDRDAIAKAHKYGINSLMPAFYALDYDSIMSLADDFFSDKSESGVTKANIFGELLGSTGTAPSAVAIRDLIIQGRFDNDRDAARALTGIGYHLHRGSKQLLKEMEKLFDITENLGRFTKMAVPRAFGNMVRATCAKAGATFSEGWRACVEDVGAHYTNMAWERFQATDDKNVQIAMLDAIYNIRFGGSSTLLKPLIDGKITQDPQLRTRALWAASWDAVVTYGADYFLPYFADRSNPTEFRLAALEYVFWSDGEPAHIMSVLAVLFKEEDYEVTNFAVTLMERVAANIDPCRKKMADRVAIYLKFVKQYTKYNVDWGFGVSKTYSRQFYKKKYGYSGSYIFRCYGSHQSTTPLSIMMGISSSQMGGSYWLPLGTIYFRMEGLAKAVVRKFKKMDPATWKTEDLERILSGDMGIRERPNQPVRVQVTIELKGAVVFSRYYDENSASGEGKLATFLEGLKGLGDTYSINHQRAVQGGGLLYEQPTGVGIPLVTMSSFTTLGHLTATVKRGNHRGLLYRDVKYNIQFFTQASRITFVSHPIRKASYGIVNDRLYHVDVPRKFVIGVNPVKMELKLSISRPTFEKPWKIFMHSQTEAVVRGHNIQGTYQGLSSRCPTCTENRVLVTRGPEFVKSRTFMDRTNERIGATIKGEYFDCEMDISKKNTVGHLLGAFMPYNKQPRTAWTSIMMGIRQTRAFFLYFPKNEQCGAMFKWSQSQNNPVNEIEISIRGTKENNGQRLFFRGRKVLIKAMIKAKGEPADRVYRVNIAYETTPGNLENSFKMQINRAPVPALDMSPYSICFALENKYPDFSEQFLGYNEDAQMEVTGKAMLQYGPAVSCKDGDGEIQLSFRHSTTEEARQELRNKYYYRRCMEVKNTPAWSGRKALPITEDCYQTVYDATSARKYSWNFKFVKLTPRVEAFMAKVRTAVKAGFLPYWDVDPETIGSMDGDIGPKLNLDVTLKEDEKIADIRVETRHGEESFDNVPLRLNWSNKLRNLKFTKTIKKLYDKKIISKCLLIFIAVFAFTCNFLQTLAS